MFRTILFAVFILTLINVAAQNTVIPKVSSGKIIRIINFPSQYVDPRTIDIWLPEHYSPRKKYAVLYMHDGQMLFDSSITWNHQAWAVDSTLGALIRKRKIRDCIVVGIWNNGLQRHAEYWPQKAFALLSDSAREIILREKKILNASGSIRREPISDQYLKFIVTELKPYIDSNFSVYPDLSHTFIAGSSMGGLISLYTLCEYPQVFGGAACLSTHWTGIYRLNNNPAPDCILQYLASHIPDPSTHKIYFDHGDKTLDSLYVPLQPRVDSLFKASGFTSSNYKSKYFPGEDHSENAWRKRFGVPAVFLLTRRK